MKNGTREIDWETTSKLSSYRLNNLR
jgi:hypothetical protein